MENFIIQEYNLFLHYYFWIFIIIVILAVISINSNDYEKSKEASINNGTYLQRGLSFANLIAITLWVMSWYH